MNDGRDGIEKATETSMSVSVSMRLKKIVTHLAFLISEYMVTDRWRARLGERALYEGEAC